MPRRYEEWTCPRCARVVLPQYPALSRVDNESEICGDCRNGEALFGVVPVDEWPLGREER